MHEGMEGWNHVIDSFCIENWHLCIQSSILFSFCVHSALLAPDIPPCGRHAEYIFLQKRTIQTPNDYLVCRTLFHFYITFACIVIYFYFCGPRFSFWNGGALDLMTAIIYTSLFLDMYDFDFNFVFPSTRPVQFGRYLGL